MYSPVGGRERPTLYADDREGVIYRACIQNKPGSNREYGVMVNRVGL